MKPLFALILYNPVV